jgi:hypothetical protein
VLALEGAAIWEIGHPDILGSTEPDLADADAIARHVRVQLRMMAGESFAISRFVMQYAVGAFRGMSALDVDEMLRRVVYAAALRSHSSGGATITVEDVHAALRGISHRPAPSQHEG